MNATVSAAISQSDDSHQDCQTPKFSSSGRKAVAMSLIEIGLAIVLGGIIFRAVTFFGLL